MTRRESRPGFTLVELLVVLVVVAAVAAVALPPALDWGGGLVLDMAAAEVVATLRTARSLAIRHNAYVAVRFEEAASGGVTHTFYIDGDGDGVRSRDIEAGVDRPLGPSRSLRHFQGRVAFGFPPGVVPRDPGDPRRRLRDLGRPVRFGRSHMASFSPLGQSTPGSIYLTDRRGRLAAVRVLGTSARIRVLRYDAATETWR